MKSKDQQHDVGVIVGRFQVHELHGPHKELIEEVVEQHDKVIIFLGLSPLMVTTENPLDFEARKQMILDEFPQVNVVYIKDKNSDEVWSKELDDQIKGLVAPSQRVVLYGGRDSFIKHYSGKHPTLELEPDVYVRTSGTQVRKEIAKQSTKASPDFRAGVVWAALNKFPTCYTTVDVAVLNDDETEVLLAKKPHEGKWRFIGGFADPGDPTFETTARREVQEEAHIDITDPKYIGSFVIDDWRYRGEADKIKTLFFVAKRFSGSPKPDDDIEELKWFKLVPKNTTYPEKGIAYLEEMIMPNHLPLMEALQETILDTDKGKNHDESNSCNR